MSASVLPLGSDGPANMQSKLRNLYHASKLDIRIKLNKPRSTYTTLDRIEGTVSITAPTDTSFDDVDVEFVGTSRTYVERLTTAAAISGRSEAFHQFLKLQDNSIREHLPEDMILRAGREYELPFLFVVPEQLLPRVCQHKVVGPALRDAHTQLPPTFGDKDESAKSAKSKALDDMVPDMASTRYGVFARITKLKEQGDEMVKTTIGSKARRIRIIPASAEQPPLDALNDPEYTMRKERRVRKGVLKGKLGTLVMEAIQPPSLHMRPRAHSQSSEDQATSMATIMLRFDPAEDDVSHPPSLSGLSTKLKVCTYFSSTARQSYPTKQMSLLDLSQGLHSEQLNLSSRCMSNGVRWTEHDPKKSDTLDRRDSACSTYSMSPEVSPDMTPEPSEKYKGKKFWTAKLLVPVTLPSHKAFVPTFHSCLISRVYQLKLELGLPNTGFGTMDLKVPLQVSVARSQGENSPRRGSVASMLNQDVSDEDVSDFFEPRTIHVPDVQFSGRSRIGSQAPVEEDAPPDYTALPRAIQRVPPVY